MKKYISYHITYDDYLVLKVGNTVRYIALWKLNPKDMINNILVKINVRPYRTVTLKTGVIVNHYKSGKIDVQS
jgi:hypothetical protein